MLSILKKLFGYIPDVAKMSDKALSDERETLEGFGRGRRTEAEQQRHAEIGREQQRRADARAKRHRCP